MADIQYFSGLPEVGVVPRAPHAGPLLQHVYEQEHGRRGFSGKVSHTYDPARLDDVRAIAERLSGARDALRPPTT